MKKIIVNGIDIIKCKHLRIDGDKNFYCKKSTYEYICNPLTIECPIYVAHLKSKIIELEQKILYLETKLQVQQQDSCHFDKIKELTKEM